jgi:UDP-N-acetylmuramoylalanine--D-glutamate ligase
LRELKHIAAKTILGKHDPHDFLQADIIIKNPEIRRNNPFLLQAVENNAVIDTPCGIFSEIHPKPFIGITGTKGKSYTTHLTSHLIKSFLPKTLAAGNNCISPLRYVHETDRTFVLELSSWQLYEMGLHQKSPHVACWLNFFPDHMNYYSETNEYLKDKYNITKYQDRNSMIVLPWNHSFHKSLPIQAQKIYFDTNPDSHLPQKTEQGCFIRHKQLTLRNRDNEIKILDIRDLPGEFQCPQHLTSLVASTANLMAYEEYTGSFTLTVDPLIRAIRNFPGLSHRYETIVHNKAYHIINDSASSTPESTLMAIESIQKLPLVLILGGGGHKNLDYRKLSDRLIFQHITSIVFKDDEVSEIITERFKTYGYRNYYQASTMEEAVTQGKYLLQQMNRGTLMLSPGCSGAPFFRDMFERGALFECLVNKLFNKV